MDGILNIYKEAGYTSFDVVAKLRGILHQKKIGHTGTLDPAATGVLPVCLGKATKVCGMLTDKDKSYRAVCRLGVETDTLDMTGQIVGRSDFSSVTKEQIREVAASFLGEIMQIPPMYSALKVNGRRLYELAREGKTVERKERKVRILEMEVTDINLAEGTFSFAVTCSKGTYIRTLCQDIGKRLGTCAAMEALERTRVAIFSAEDALTVDEVAALCDADTKGIADYLYGVDALFEEYPRAIIRPEFAVKLANGNPLPKNCFTERKVGTLSDGKSVLVYNEAEEFKAIYEKKADCFFVKKMF